MLDDILKKEAHKAAYDAVIGVLGDFRHADNWALEAANKMQDLEADGKGPKLLAEASNHYTESLKWFDTNWSARGSEFHFKTIAFNAAAQSYIGKMVELNAEIFDSNYRVIHNEDGTLKLQVK